VLTIVFGQNMAERSNYNYEERTQCTWIHERINSWTREDSSAGRRLWNQVVRVMSRLRLYCVGYEGVITNW